MEGHSLDIAVAGCILFSCGGLLLSFVVAAKSNVVKLAAVLGNAAGNAKLCCRNTYKESHNKSYCGKGNSYHSCVLPAVGLIKSTVGCGLTGALSKSKRNKGAIDRIHIKSSTDNCDEDHTNQWCESVKQVPNHTHTEGALENILCSAFSALSGACKADGDKGDGEEVVYDLCVHIAVCAHIKIDTGADVHKNQSENTCNNTCRDQHISQKGDFCSQQCTYAQCDTGKSECHKKTVHLKASFRISLFNYYITAFCKIQQKLQEKQVF